MKSQEVLSKVQGIFSDVLQKPASEFAPDKKIFTDLGIESVEILELEFALEEEFDKKIGPADLWKLPGHILNNNMMKNSNLSSEACVLIKSAYALKDQEIQNLRSPNDLHKILKISDIVSFFGDRAQNAV